MAPHMGTHFPSLLIWTWWLVPFFLYSLFRVHCWNAFGMCMEVQLSDWDYSHGGLFFFQWRNSKGPFPQSDCEYIEPWTILDFFRGFLYLCPFDQKSSTDQKRPNKFPVDFRCCRRLLIETPFNMTLVLRRCSSLNTQGDSPEDVLNCKSPGWRDK